MNRIENRLNQLKKKKEKALITYMTAGLPSCEKSVEIIRAQAEAGVDVIELGVPFSDPVADGPVIQEASYKSICLGTNLKKCFEIVEETRKYCEVPIIFMLYYNTILYYGIEEFIRKCIEAGVDGIIIPDLPLEEQFEILPHLEAEGAPFLVQLVSPVSKARIPEIVNRSKGFVYCVSSMGVTGQSADFHKNIRTYLETVKKESPVPIMMGFGIRTAKDVEQLKDTIDGCIVGSHFIKLMEENKYDLSAIKAYIKEFKRELNQ